MQRTAGTNGPWPSEESDSPLHLRVRPWPLDCERVYRLRIPSWPAASGPGRAKTPTGRLLTRHPGKWPAGGRPVTRLRPSTRKCISASMPSTSTSIFMNLTYNLMPQQNHRVRSSHERRGTEVILANSSPSQPKVCAARGCRERLPAQSGRGRRRIYCSARCRSISVARNGALRVEVDHAGDDESGRPTGRVWLVRMRRGKDEVIVATELCRPSADHLAAQIAHLIFGPQRAQGSATE